MKNKDKKQDTPEIKTTIELKFSKEINIEQPKSFPPVVSSEEWNKARKEEAKQNNKS